MFEGLAIAFSLTFVVIRTLGGLGFFYIFYTVPLTVASSQVDRDTIAWLFPEQEWMKSYGINIPDLISGLTSSMIWSCFFMLCPQVFKVSLSRCCGGQAFLPLTHVAADGGLLWIERYVHGAG